MLQVPRGNWYDVPPVESALLMPLDGGGSPNRQMEGTGLGTDAEGADAQAVLREQRPSPYRRQEPFDLRRVQPLS
jgi:hypothetical protein